MAVLEWDKPGTRTYESGIDHGVLYLMDGRAVPWNGLTSVTENESRQTKSYYLDGRKYLEYQVPGTFQATLKAYTYPDEFEQINGAVEVYKGIFLLDQPNQMFHLSYRTRKGDDLDGSGYKLHILFNLQATPADKEYTTQDLSLSPLEFSWILSSTPPDIQGFRNTAHIIVDSDAFPAIIEIIERILYGDEFTEPSLGDVDSFIDSIFQRGSIEITDYHDGTWSAEGPDRCFTLTEANRFRITDVQANYLPDGYTYVVTDTIIIP